MTKLMTTRERIEWEYRPRRAKYHSGGFDRQDNSAGIFEISVDDDTRLLETLFQL